MIEHIVLVKGTFGGIYEWGKGYLNGKGQLWREALADVKDIMWKVVTKDDHEYLLSVQGSIYLHPMDFRTVLHSCGCHSADTFDCGNLLKICNKIAEHCGGTFKLEVSKPFDVEAEMFPYTEGIHNTLSY